MTSYLTETELLALQQSALTRDAPYAILGVSHGFFSIARHYGGADYNGHRDTYNPATDELIRSDVLKWIEGKRRLAAKVERAEAHAMQGQLL